METTPDWFQRPEANASTGYYADSDGDLWQMVRDRDFAWAQGTRTSVRPNTRLPRPTWWRDEYVSYNTCMLSIEIEGYAREIADTFVPGSRQFEAVAAWAAFQCAKYRDPGRSRASSRPRRALHDEVGSRPRLPLGRAARSDRRTAGSGLGRGAGGGGRAPACRAAPAHARRPAPDLGLGMTQFRQQRAATPAARCCWRCRSRC